MNKEEINDLTRQIILQFQLIMASLNNKFIQFNHHHNKIKIIILIINKSR